MRLHCRGLTHFNPIQTQTFASLYETDGNVLVAAPASSGKALCAEFAMLRAFRSDPAGARCVYVAPLAALVESRYREWSALFGAESSVPLRVSRLTGETAADLRTMTESHVVLATPEHWDMLSRRWKQRKAVQQVCALLL